MIHAVAFDFTAVTEETIDPAAIPDALAAGRFCWVDLDAEPPESAGALLRQMGLNPQAIEGVLGPDQEGRHDLYDDCVHCAVTESRRSHDRLQTVHIDVVIARQVLVTSHRTGSEVIHLMQRAYRDDFRRFARSPGFLLYEMGDSLLEVCRRSLQSLADAVDHAREDLMGRMDDALFARVFDLIRDLAAFRKTVLASRELLHALASRRSPFVPESTQPYLERMAAAMERLGGDLNSERECLSESLNLYMGMVSHHTNKVVNRLTILSMVFLPLSFVCAIYGMNFKIPETEWRHGYVYFWALMLAISGGLLSLMRRRRWI